MRAKYVRRAACGAAALALALAALALGVRHARQTARHDFTGFAMDTVVTQTVYGPAAKAAIPALTRRLAALEEQLSQYAAGDIGAVNAAAGRAPVAVGADTLRLVRQALQLAGLSRGAFAVTAAPLTRLWNVTGAAPSRPQPQALAAALALVGDDELQLDEKAGTLYLPREGQGIDLGGIAKGWACDEARALYLQNGVRSALLQLGGSVCAVGARPDGTPFRIGFRDPAGGEESYIASFALRDGMVAVSGGYERYFEEDGVRYHHIFDLATGWPVQGDIVSVGVVAPADVPGEYGAGLLADFWSTTLFCWGLQPTLEWMRTAAPLGALVLAADGRLYVSQCLAEGFVCEKEGLDVVFVEAAP